jgi:hypothetical protein
MPISRAFRPPNPQFWGNWAALKYSFLQGERPSRLVSPDFGGRGADFRLKTDSSRTTFRQFYIKCTAGRPSAERPPDADNAYRCISDNIRRLPLTLARRAFGRRPISDWFYTGRDSRAYKMYDDTVRLFIVGCGPCDRPKDFYQTVAFMEALTPCPPLPIPLGR